MIEGAINSKIEKKVIKQKGHMIKYFKLSKSLHDILEVRLKIVS